MNFIAPDQKSDEHKQTIIDCMVIYTDKYARRLT